MHEDEDTGLVTTKEDDENISENDESQKLQRDIYIPVLGAVMGIMSGFCFSVCSFIVKYLNHVDCFEFSTIRVGGILLPTAIIVIWAKENPLGPKEKRGFLLFRGVIGAISLIMQFYALQAMPLGDASAIICSAPVFVAIFARIFLKEYCGIFNIISILMTVAGVILITKPPFLIGDDAYKFGYSEKVVYGSVAALTCTILIGNVYVLLRYLKDVHYAVVMLTFSVVAIVITGSATLLFGNVSASWSTSDYLIIFLFVLFTFGGQTLLTKASQLEQAGPVAIYRTSDIVFAFIWQSIFFKEVPHVLSICGALLITASVILTGLNKWLLTPPAQLKQIESSKSSTSP